MKAFIVIVLLALLGWWAYSHHYLKPEWLGLGGSASGSKSSAPESLQDALNRGLPRMVSSDISLDRAASNSLAVSFDFRLVDLDEYAITQRYGSTMPAEMRTQLISSVCAMSAVREQVLAKGRDIQIQLRAQDGRTVYNTQLRPGGC